MALMRIISVAILVIGVNVRGAPGPQGTGPAREPPEIFQKCAMDTGLKVEGMMNDTVEVTPEFLCFFKCVGEESGVITETGELDLSKASALPVHLPRALRGQFNDCLAKMTKIEKCEDMKESAECVAALHNAPPS